MHKIFSIYAFIEVGILIFAVMTLVLWDRRYKLFRKPYCSKDGAFTVVGMDITSSFGIEIGDSVIRPNIMGTKQLLKLRA